MFSILNQGLFDRGEVKNFVMTVGGFDKNAKMGLDYQLIKKWVSHWQIVLEGYLEEVQSHKGRWRLD
jgi:hypothetical protein